jgi:hypothetical protein
MDLDDRISITVNYMRQNNISDLLVLKQPCSDQTSCWGSLCLLFFNEFSKIKSLNIYNMWVKNIRNFRSLVLNKLNNNLIALDKSKQLKKSIKNCFQNFL